MKSNPEITRCTPSSGEKNFIEDRLYEYNSQQTGQDDGQEFAFFIRNEQQEIVAGLYGWTWATICKIQGLWVHASLRGQGYGARLLESAEAEARERGCGVVLLDTHSFQAPDFYPKYGYELVWQMDDYPPGHCMYFFKKRLTEAESQP